MKHNSRFSQISAIIDIKRLERENRKLLWLGFAVAIIFHLAVGSFITFRQTKVKVVKPIPVDFIVVRPRITKPFMVSPKRYRKKPLHRPFRDFRTPSKGIETKALETPDVSDREPDVDIGYEIGRQRTSDILPDSLFTDDYFIRPQEDEIPLKNRLLFDTGRYKAEIIIDPYNKKAIQGYTHIAIGWGEELTPPDTLRASIRNLVRVINEHTNIHATQDQRVRLDSDELHQYSFIYITSDTSFELTETEADNLGSYLMRGGFAIIDNGVPEFEAGHMWRSFRKMILDAGLAGDPPEQVFWIRTVYKNDPLYHCFFDFDNGAPPGSISMVKVQGVPFKNIMGVYYGRQLVGIYCPQGYGRSWGNRKNTIQLRMGVNFVVYAVSQGKWSSDDYRKTVYDRNTGDFIEWYDNGQVRFMASELRTSNKPVAWNPRNLGSDRVVQVDLLRVTQEIFLYNDDFEFLVNRNKSIRFHAHGLKVIPWGKYNKYRGWYRDGRKMYDYDHDARTFVEWDDFGTIIKQGNGHGSEKITPVAKK